MEGRPSSEIETVLTWQNAVGLPITLAEVGLDSGDEDAIRAIAQRTVQKGETVHNSPFPVTAHMIEENIKIADHIGERFKEKHMI
jgi:glycerol dehydrogenase